MTVIRQLELVSLRVEIRPLQQSDEILGAEAGGKPAPYPVESAFPAYSGQQSEPALAGKLEPVGQLVADQGSRDAEDVIGGVLKLLLALPARQPDSGRVGQRAGHDDGICAWRRFTDAADTVQSRALGLVVNRKLIRNARQPADVTPVVHVAFAFLGGSFTPSFESPCNTLLEKAAVT